MNLIKVRTKSSRLVSAVSATKNNDGLRLHT